jgi:hypothetical protein
MVVPMPPIRRLSLLWLSSAFISASYTLIAPRAIPTAGDFTAVPHAQPQGFHRQLLGRDNHSARAFRGAFEEGR